MEEVKYQVGDRFYTAYCTAPNFQSDFNNQLFVITVAVITKITIDRKKVVYSVREYLKSKQGFTTRESEKSTKDLNGYHSTPENALEDFAKLFKEKFDYLDSEVAKEKLSDVLNGR